MTDTFISLLAYVPYYPHGGGSAGGTGTPLDIFGSHTAYWIIFFGAILASWLVSSTLKRRFREYSQIGMPLSGREVAERMLRDNKITDVQVISTPGQLTDHYNPANKTVNLSEGVYNGYSVAAAAVAAHEVGHAVQHATAYHWLTMRSKLVPVVQLSSNLVQWVLLLGLIMMAAGNNTTVLGVGVALLGITTLFAFITLPVEFDASRRALAWLGRSNTGSYMEQSKAKNALFWAAMTYVVGALSSLAMLLHYLAIFLGSRRSE